MIFMTSILLAALLVLSGCMAPPSPRQEPLYYTMQASRLLDGCTTLGVSENDNLIETNPLLDRNPSDEEVVAHVAGGMLLQHLLYSAFKRYSKNGHHWIAGGFTAVNLGVSASNFSKGANCP